MHIEDEFIWTRIFKRKEVKLVSSKFFNITKEVYEIICAAIYIYFAHVGLIINW